DLAATASRSVRVGSRWSGRSCRSGRRGCHAVSPGPPVEGLASLARELELPTLAGPSSRPDLIRSADCSVARLAWRRRLSSIGPRPDCQIPPESKGIVHELSPPSYHGMDSGGGKITLDQ